LNHYPTFPETLAELRDVLRASVSLAEAVERAGKAIIAGLESGGKLFTCGNGGSAADALHLAEELTGRYRMSRRALPAICLSADATALTCIANDFGYEEVFARQIEALARHGDILVGFSTSGSSANVCKAFQAAKERGAVTILLSGNDGGTAKGGCEHEIIVPSRSTARIQEVHTLILHQWLEAIDANPWNMP
jgi:D-sedoheptulose 7-phosphate isomerase